MTQQRSSDIWVLLKKASPFLLPPSPWTFAPAMTETLYMSPALPVSQRHLNSLGMEKISDVRLHQESHHVKSFHNIRFRLSYKPLFLQINWNWTDLLDILSPGTSCGSLPPQPAEQSPVHQRAAEVSSLAEDSHWRFPMHWAALLRAAVMLLLSSPNEKRGAGPGMANNSWWTTRKRGVFYSWDRAPGNVTLACRRWWVIPEQRSDGMRSVLVGKEAPSRIREDAEAQEEWISDPKGILLCSLSYTRWNTTRSVLLLPPCFTSKHICPETRSQGGDI